MSAASSWRGGHFAVKLSIVAGARGKSRTIRIVLPNVARHIALFTTLPAACTAQTGHRASYRIRLKNSQTQSAEICRSGGEFQAVRSVCTSI